jgi:hypothetical protein
VRCFSAATTILCESTINPFLFLTNLINFRASSSSSSSAGGPSRHAAAAPTVAPTTSPKPDEHPCLAVLKTKTKGTKTLPERKKIPQDY